MKCLTQLNKYSFLTDTFRTSISLETVWEISIGLRKSTVMFRRLGIPKKLRGPYHICYF